MGFTLYCIIEAALLLANAIAILNDRFLKQSNKSLNIMFSWVSCGLDKHSIGPIKWC